MPSPLHVVRVGTGPVILLIHGSAVDHTTWSIQLGSPLAERFTLVTYDRRVDASVEDHADDAIRLLGDAPAPALIVGVSFGAVIALDVIRRYPVAGAVLVEPPMAVTENLPAGTAAFLAEFDRRVAADGGPAAAELFLRTVLGDTMYERIPEVFQERSKAKWAEIRADSAALLAYRPRYAELATVTTPVRLLGGDRSAPYFRLTLDTLQRSLPNSRVDMIANAGHLLHVEAHRRFNAVIDELGREVFGLP